MGLRSLPTVQLCEYTEIMGPKPKVTILVFAQHAHYNTYTHGYVVLLNSVATVAGVAGPSSEIKTKRGKI